MESSCDKLEQTLLSSYSPGPCFLGFCHCANNSRCVDVYMFGEMYIRSLSPTLICSTASLTINHRQASEKSLESITFTPIFHQYLFIAHFLGSPSSVLDPNIPSPSAFPLQLNQNHIPNIMHPSLMLPFSLLTASTSALVLPRQAPASITRLAGGGLLPSAPSIT